MLIFTASFKSKFFPQFYKLLEYEHVCDTVLAVQSCSSNSEQKCCTVLKTKRLNPYLQSLPELKVWAISSMS